MGTDIHFYVENRVDANSPWISADKGWKEEDGYLTIPYQNRFYEQRNYDLFAMLADVRNGVGLPEILPVRDLFLFMSPAVGRRIVVPS